MIQRVRRRPLAATTVSVIGASAGILSRARIVTRITTARSVPDAAGAAVPSGICPSSMSRFGSAARSRRRRKRWARRCRSATSVSLAKPHLPHRQQLIAYVTKGRYFVSNRNR